MKIRIGLLVLSSLFLLSFIQKDNKKKFTYGKIENGKYLNSYFDMEMVLPEKWVIQNKEQIAHLEETGRDLAAGDDKNLQRAIKSGQMNSATLLVLFKHEVGAAVDFNPSFSLLAEGVAQAPGIKTGADYLYSARKILRSSQVKMICSEEFEKFTIDNHDFYRMSVIMEYGGAKINQEYCSTILNGYALSYIISYRGEEQKAELDKTLATITFTK